MFRTKQPKPKQICLILTLSIILLSRGEREPVPFRLHVCDSWVLRAQYDLYMAIHQNIVLSSQNLLIDLFVSHLNIFLT